jgi:hypothetical protein
VKLKQFARLKGIGFKGKHNKEHFIKAIEEFLNLHSTIAGQKCPIIRTLR